MKSPRFFTATCLGVALALATFLSAGCAGMFFSSHRTEYSSSVVAYLYPGKDQPLPPTTIPVLRLPLRVGIVFVPNSDRGRTGYYQFGTGLSELQKTALMRRVADQFKGRDFIQSIEVIPSSYLRPDGGFANLDQVRALMNIDVVVLVAYNQVQFTNENFLSLAYWTIVGAYVVQGNKNDTQTLMEAAVYDIPSRHLLFRAPGGSQIRASSAAKYVSADLQADSAKGFDAATTDLISNLQAQLDEFRERVKRTPGEVQIERRPGYTGGGDCGPGFAGGLALLGIVAWLRRRR